jgi:hypothetical protein
VIKGEQYTDHNRGRGNAVAMKLQICRTTSQLLAKSRQMGVSTFALQLDDVVLRVGLLAAVGLVLFRLTLGGWGGQGP